MFGWESNELQVVNNHCGNHPEHFYDTSRSDDWFAEGGDQQTVLYESHAEVRGDALVRVHL